MHRHSRVDRAMVATVSETVTNDVSTRKVEKVASTIVTAAKNACGDDNDDGRCKIDNQRFILSSYPQLLVNWYSFGVR